MNAAAERIALRAPAGGLDVPGSRETHLSVFSPAPLGAGGGLSWLLFQQRLDSHLRKCIALWERAGATTPCLGPVIPLGDKLRREAQADEHAKEVEERLRQMPRSPERRDGWRGALLHRMVALARSNLGVVEAGLEPLFSRNGVDATRQFVRSARAFDPGISDESLFQALRNLWIVNSIQLLMQRPIVLSPAAFAYSMLYPWTDNYLDDPLVSGPSKLEFGAWLERRLCGLRAVPTNPHAAQVSRLVGMIESHFPREEFEEIYLSLRAIHHAQMASLEQQQAQGLPIEHDRLRVTFRKGGASVLPDAFIVARTLSQAEAEFMFGFGVLLQLLDDIQDLQRDLENGHATIFAPRGGGTLDGATSRLWSFARLLLWSSNSFAAQKHRPVKNLIQESCKLTVLQAVARHQHLYSAGFAAEMEAYSPFRFSYMRERESAAAKDDQKLLAFLRQERGLRSVFDLLVI